MTESSAKPTKQKSIFWRWVRRLFWLALAGFLLVLGINLWIVESTQSRIYSKVEDVPATRFGLVLGTVRHIENSDKTKRWENLHFKNRMQAAAELFHAKKVEHFILSGDNSKLHYNEPKDMQDALKELGVPAEATTLDYAGFSTLETIARAKQAGLKECVVITEDYHLPRALFLAEHYDLKATGYSAEPIVWEKSSKTRQREWLARVKMMLDIYILRTKPTYSGEKIPLPP